MKKVKVLLTKSFSDEYLKGFDADNLEWLQHPFIKFNYKHLPDLQKQIEANSAPFIFTSQNAVIGFEKNAVLNEERKVCFCLNGATQSALKNSGWKTIATANTSEALADKIVQSNITEAIFCCGNIRMNVIPDKLHKAAIELREFVVYDTVFNATSVKQHFDLIVFFSPSGVESFFVSNSLSNEVIAFCIGESTAQALSQFWKGRVVKSDTPSAKSLLHQIVAYSLNLAL